MPHIQAPFSQLHLYNSQLATFIIHVAAIHCSVCFLLNVGDYLRVRPRCIYILLYIHKHERHKSMNCTICIRSSHQPRVPTFSMMDFSFTLRSAAGRLVTLGATLLLVMGFGSCGRPCLQSSRRLSAKTVSQDRKQFSAGTNKKICKKYHRDQQYSDAPLKHIQTQDVGAMKLIEAHCVLPIIVETIKKTSSVHS